MDAEPTRTDHLVDVTDAVARGRLCLGEIVGVSAAELQAMLDAGCNRLDTGRPEQASELLAALVTLAPYEARFWRAYAIALHRSGTLVQARAAYKAALHLDAFHPMTRCYLAEVMLLLGELDGLALLESVAAIDRHPAAERAKVLLQLLAPPPAKQAVPPAREEPAEVSSLPTAFFLPDGRPLPLSGGRFDADVQPSEVTAPMAENPERTDTAIVDRGGPSSSAPSADTITARVRRPSRWPTAVERRHGGPRLSEDITLTDVKLP